MEFINQTIGKYKLTRLIGEGGMASVYEGVHETLDTKVAVKILNPILSTNKQIRERFVSEAKIMASFNHINITKIIDFEEAPNYLAIIMELLEGQDLNDFIKNNSKLTDEKIISIFSQILVAFQYAHEKGVIHRDIKPSNIFILKDGTVKILDFGIAKLFGQGNEMTQTGTQIGTPVFMSPEQVKSDKSIDHRSDIYSLGVMLYFLINGKAPYDATTDSQFDIFSKIVYEPLPEMAVQSSLSHLVYKACQKERELRFQSCMELIETLLNEKKIFSISSEKKFANNDITFDSIEYKLNNQLEKESNIDINITSKINKNKNVLIFSILGGFALLMIIAIMAVYGTGKNIEVKIGNQVWMAKNLDVDKFRNGDAIPQAKTDKEWIAAGKNKQPAWCNYDATASEIHGKLYNWYAVNDPRGLAPSGWHVSSDAEWKTLKKYLGVYAGKRMKNNQGWFENGNGINSSGFSGLPGGERSSDGSYYSIGYYGYWWCSTPYTKKRGWYRNLRYENANVGGYYFDKGVGLSVRCIKD